MTNSNILTAVVTQVSFGDNLQMEGLLVQDGNFAVAVPQIALLFPYFKTDTNNASILLKRLMGKDFKTDRYWFRPSNSWSQHD